MVPVEELRDLVLRAKAGDVGAISDLYDRFARVLVRYMLVRVGEPELAQDLTQEVFIRVIKGIARLEYRDEKAFLGWLYTIAANVLSSYLRRHRVVVTPLEGQEDLLQTPSDARHILDRVALREAIEQLTSDQQRVLTLRFFADLTNGEIATLLNRSEGAVKAIQYRALQSMHRLLSHEHDQYAPDDVEREEALPLAEQEVGWCGPRQGRAASCLKSEFGD